MESKVREIYAEFNDKKKELEAQEANAEDIKLLKDLEKRILNKK